MMLLRFLHDVPHRIIIYSVSTIMQLYSVAFFFLFIFQCWPSSYFWTRFSPGHQGTCLPTLHIVYASYGYSAIMCIVDWTYSILPIVIVWKMQALAGREKVLVGILLGLGAV